jgi:undecaprenyl-diphosphatase
LRALDLEVYKALNGLAANADGFEDVFKFVSEVSAYVFLALLAWLFLARGNWRSANARHGVVAAGFSALLAVGAANVIAHIVDRPRPYVAHPGDAHLFVGASPDPSFPSDHATAAFAIAVAILLRSRRPGWLALAMATAVAVSRVVVGTHYPSDVLGGALLGALAALLLWLPWIRGPLDSLADRVADLYDTLASRAYGDRPDRPKLLGAAPSRRR